MNLTELIRAIIDRHICTRQASEENKRLLTEAIVKAIPKREHGEWKLANDDDCWLEYHCTKCHESIVIANSEVMAKVMYMKPRPTYSFCPNCGADMRGDNK